MKLKKKSTFLLLTIILLSTNIAGAQILDKQKMLDKFNFWHNKDWNWYKKNIPFIETPDSDIDITWYYRWELITDHAVYGSPEDGYAFTEFIDRPWWSGTYGAISCPAGHQLYELRWLRNPMYAEDYAGYFFNVAGAQPRNYSTWIADAVWQMYKTYQDYKFSVSILPQLETNYKGWEVEHYVPKEGLFAWDGMHDGMETNINSRQTKDWFAGAPGYRPTLNSYMWADAKAIANLNELKGNDDRSRLYVRKADTIKQNFQLKCWNAKRDFFFHRFQNDEEGGIKANTLTYETGKYAGNEHGREEIGFIPWYFNMPDTGYESAWKFVTDSNYFFAKYGPTTVEKQDPLFKIAKNCCAWSGNAWPYATSQTLKAMANLLKYYPHAPISKNDYFNQLKIFSLTQRKNGEPYIAEANDPETGSWSGHDTPNHSENYFHSSYIDLVITGLLGLEPMASDSVELHPLIPDSWDFFTLDDVYYHGHTLSVIWDKTGNKYKKGKGLSLWIDGKKAASVPAIERMVVAVPKSTNIIKKERRVNLAANNSTANYYPKAFASFPGIGANIYNKLNDGQFFYYKIPANRWTNEGSDGDGNLYAGIDFGVKQQINEVIVYFINDFLGTVRTPAKYHFEYWAKGKWIPAPETKRSPAQPEGDKGNHILLKKISTTKIRIIMEPDKDHKVGISEIEAWGDKKNYERAAMNNIKDAAFYKQAALSYSYTSQFDNPKGINDGIPNPANRWTGYESPNNSDWVNFKFNKVKNVSEVLLYVYDDKGGVQPPRQYAIQYWNGTRWSAVINTHKLPEAPQAGLNLCSFSSVKTNQLRITLTHQSNKIYSGLYGVEIY